MKVSIKESCLDKESAGGGEAKPKSAETETYLKIYGRSALARSKGLEV